MNQSQSIIDRYSQSVLGNYGRFPLVIESAREFEVFDVDGRRYLDMGFGIAVNCLGHGHPELSECLQNQLSKLDHVSNLYFFEEQVFLAEKITSLLSGGKVFFCNSGAEANEALIKLARKFGNASSRFEIITTTNSFHGRTLATIAATGQDKVKVGFGPSVQGFKHVPFNDIEALRKSITAQTCAILIEGVQGEGGLVPAAPEYIKGIQELCKQHNLLFLMDGVQCGMYRTGRFQSIQRILNLDENDHESLPSAISMAKSLGGGFPIGAIWIKDLHHELLGPGSHGTTYGGNPLTTAISSKIFEIIQRDKLDLNIIHLEAELRNNLETLRSEFPDVIDGITGLGFMTGIILNTDAKVFQSNQGVSASIQMCNKLHEQGLLLIPAGPKVVRFLPAYNIQKAQIEEAISILRKSIQLLLNQAANV